MMRIVLWLAAGAAIVLGVLFLMTRAQSGGGDKAEPAPAVEAAAPAPAPVVEAPTVAEPEPPPIDQQVAEDAAAVGMTTREPPAEAAEKPPR